VLSFELPSTLNTQHPISIVTHVTFMAGSWVFYIIGLIRSIRLLRHVVHEVIACHHWQKWAGQNLLRNEAFRFVPRFADDRHGMNYAGSFWYFCRYKRRAFRSGDTDWFRGACLWERSRFLPPQEWR